MIQTISSKSLSVRNGDCATRDLNSSAETMDDIANIIEDVGIDNIKDMLEEDFDLSFIFSQF